jgi:hypothetical protein
MNTKLELIDQSIQKILTDGKIDQYDIPELVLLISQLISSSSIVPTSTEDLETKINETYQYAMARFNLYPQVAEEKEAFDRLFKSSMKLVLFQPLIKSKCDRFWSSCKLS